jgi:hypothetical protein
MPIRFFCVPSSQVSGDPWFLGVKFIHLAACHDARGPNGWHRIQVRVGFIWWHIGITFSAPRLVKIV